MGISGLLPFLKDALVNVNVRQFEGQTVAIDTYCWIYRGAFGCAEDLAMGRPADGHIKYVLRYVNKLLEWGIKPIMIFDGSCLPSKKGTELKRRESKDTYRKKAAQLLKEGRVNEARECFQRCIECTPKMALEVIQALHSIGVDVLVAPYEADAQLAYLNKANIAQLIITEDSDLILFGCEKILYKMDINGNAQLIEKQKIISVTQFDSADNFERFRWMCILSGCDYLENLPGIGLGKAKKLLKSIQKSDIDKILKQMPKILKMPNLVVSNEYIESFKKADNTFRYQIVFDPIKRKLVSLHPYSPDINENEDLTYAGIFYDDKLALQHSLGNIDVNSREVVYSFEPDKWKYKPPLKFINNPPAHMRSIWSETYTTMKNSTPFTNSAKPISLSYPMSKDRVKTISSKPLTEQLSNTMVKRKFESLDLDSQESISSSSCSSSRVPDEKENEADAKKSRLICASQNDVDQLVSQYSDSSYFAKKSSFKEETASVYFTSNQSSSKDSPSSPLVIKKPSQKFAIQNKTEECKFILAVKKSPASPSRGENEDKNDDEECMSPIVVIEKSSQASSQVKSSTKLSMFARESSKSRRFLFEFGAEENTNEESKTKTTLTILDDLDKMDRKKVNENSAAKKPSSKAGKLANDPTPKITNFLAKYQHTSTNQFKLNK